MKVTQLTASMVVTQLTASGYITTTLTYVLSICSSQWTQTVESRCADTLLHRCLSFAWRHLRTGVQTLQSVVSIEQAVDSFKFQSHYHVRSTVVQNFH